MGNRFNFRQTRLTTGNRGQMVIFSKPSDCNKNLRTAEIAMQRGMLVVLQDNITDKWYELDVGIKNIANRLVHSGYETPSYICTYSYMYHFFLQK